MLERIKILKLKKKKSAIEKHTKFSKNLLVTKN